MTQFSDLGLHKTLLDALTTKGYTTPTPIQEQSIPIILSGKDMFGCAQTGTGKTAAFALPTLQLLMESDKEPGRRNRPIRSLILTPTRELAIQIAENYNKYGDNTELNCAVIYGGVSQVPQVKILRNGVDILIATPGRLLDLLNQKVFTLGQLEIFVLDEADRMLDMGFIRDIRKILTFLPNKRQNLFFSATMAPEIMDLAHTILKNPETVEISPVSSTVDTVSQSLYTVSKENKKNLLLHLLQNKDIKNTIIFTKTKHGANKVEDILKKANIPSAAIHGNKSQNARQKALVDLKSGAIRALVATDIAARGIDISELSHVIIYDVPLEPEVYVHRIGRTGRAGMTGDAIMFCDNSEIKYLKQIIRLIGKEIPRLSDQPFHADLDVKSNISGKSSSPKHDTPRPRSTRNGEKAEKRPSSRNKSTFKNGEDIEHIERKNPHFEGRRGDTTSTFGRSKIEGSTSTYGKHRENNAGGSYNKPKTEGSSDRNYGKTTSFGKPRSESSSGSYGKPRSSSVGSEGRGTRGPKKGGPASGGNRWGSKK